MLSDNLSTVILTAGDVLGIGPEIITKALTSIPDQDQSRVYLVDPAGSLAEEQKRFSLAGYVGPRQPINMTNFSPLEAGKFAWEALEIAAETAKKFANACVVTAPVNKTRLRSAGFSYPGQTEFFASRWGGDHPIMMLCDQKLRVVPLTIHMALKDVPTAVTEDLFLKTINILTLELQQKFSIKHPKIAICGINPHAGESGHMGREEIDAIKPWIESCQPNCLAELDGPLAADGIFMPDNIGKYDAILGMYHDQVLVPFKALAFAGGVNATLGLKYLRTSPDHGTADDIVGKNVADPRPMIAAMKMALDTTYAQS